MPRRGKTFPEALVDGLKDAELIIHAGDINKDYVIYELEEFARVEYVLGNTDNEDEGLKAERKKVVSADGCNIGIIHGEGQKVDCVVFGHSHIPMNEVIDNVLYFNPGSPTDKRRQEKFSYGVLTVGEGKVTGEIVYFDKIIEKR
jgi:uncharacterized protein